MTNTGPATNPGDITVTGQRRRPNGSFPSGGGGGGSGEGSGTSPDIQDEPDTGQPGVSPPNPCADPATALEWNADAVVAGAAQEFVQRAANRNPPEDLEVREWGAYLYQDANGSVRLGPINFGDPFVNGGGGSVVLLEDGSQTSIIGSVHSHSLGNHLPSDGNTQYPGDIQHLASMAAYSGNASVRLYIVSRNTGPAGFTPYPQINVYNNATARSARDTFTPGPEVNPNGQPCPGS